MRIINIVQRPQRRGAEVFAFQLSEHLRRQGHDVLIAYLYPFDGPCGLPVSPPDIVLQGRSDHPLERIPGLDPRLARRLLNVVDEFGPEVVQVNGGRTTKYGAAVRRLRPTSPWALVSRSIGDPAEWIVGWQRRAFYRAVIPTYDGVVSVSRSALEHLTTMFPVKVPTTVIPRAVDPQQLQPEERDVTRHRMGAAEADPVVVFAGSLTREKRVDLLLDAAVLVRRRLPNLRVWIIGDGTMRATLEVSDAARQFDGRITFLGTVPDVASYFHAADLLALTSDTEGVPGVVLEAAFLGVPCVATNVGGLAECIRDGDTGLLVARGDVDGLARAMSGLLENRDRLSTMGHNAAGMVREAFLLSHAAAQYLSFYVMVREARCGRQAGLRP